MSQLIPVSKPRHRVLIVGGGSIGERHLRCFLTTGRPGEQNALAAAFWAAPLRFEAA